MSRCAERNRKNEREREREKNLLLHLLDNEKEKNKRASERIGGLENAQTAKGEEKAFFFSFSFFPSAHTRARSFPFPSHTSAAMFSTTLLVVFKMEERPPCWCFFLRRL